jgi:uncharacterized protein DUF6263
MVNAAISIPCVVVVLWPAAFARAEEPPAGRSGVAPCPAYAAGKYLLTIRQEQDRKIETRSGAKAVKIGTKRLLTIELDVREGAAKGERKIAGRFRQVQETLTLNGAVESDFDSSKKKAPRDPNHAEILSKLLAASVEVQLEPDGLARSVKGIDEAWDELIKGNPQLTKLVAEKKREIGNGLLDDYFAMIAYMAPEEGDRADWEKTMEIPNPLVESIAFRDRLRLTLEGEPKPKAAVIRLEGKGKPTKESAEIEGGGTMKDLRPGRTCRLRLAIATGLPEEFDTVLSQTMSFDYRGEKAFTLAIANETHTTFELRRTGAGGAPK